jgi:hypothetical protein
MRRNKMASPLKDTDWGKTIKALRKEFGTDPFTIAEVVAEPNVRGTMPGLSKLKKATTKAKALGRVFSGLAGRQFNGFKLKVHNDTRPKSYKVVKGTVSKKKKKAKAVKAKGTPRPRPAGGNGAPLDDSYRRATRIMLIEEGYGMTVANRLADKTLKLAAVLDDIG